MGQAIHLHSAYIEYVPLESAAPLSTPLWKDFISIVQYHSCSKKGEGGELLFNRDASTTTKNYEKGVSQLVQAANTSSSSVPSNMASFSPANLSDGVQHCNDDG